MSKRRGFPGLIERDAFAAAYETLLRLLHERAGRKSIDGTIGCFLGAFEEGWRAARRDYFRSVRERRARTGRKP